MIFFVGIIDWTTGEYARRLDLWSRLSAEGDARGLAPDAVRALGLYRGQAGIFFDGQAAWARDAPGRVALTLLNTGKTYADALVDDRLEYHYPSTNRPAAFDKNEIESVKRAQSLGLPLFVLVNNAYKATLKDVRLGYVDTYDDDAEAFFITLVDAVLPLAAAEQLPETEDDVELFGGLPKQTLRLVQQRNQQRRFKTDVLVRYGSQCALCDIDVPRLIQGAHLIPKSIGGADHAQNGLPLCLNHHTAFDAFLLVIETDGSGITYAPGVSKESLRVTRDDLTHLRAAPSKRALRQYNSSPAAKAARASWA
jgi:putative restriction endonuclease